IFPGRSIDNQRLHCKLLLILHFLITIRPHPAVATTRFRLCRERRAVCGQICFLRLQTNRPGTVSDLPAVPKNDTTPQGEHDPRSVRMPEWEAIAHTPPGAHGTGGTVQPVTSVF